MYLLDTCTLLWLVSDQSQLSQVAKDAIAGGAGRLVIAITPRIALRATALPALHNDPMDRMIVATGQLRRLTVITPERSYLW